MRKSCRAHYALRVTHYASTMFVSVVPSMRTPRGVEVFDYAVSNDRVYEPGDLVWIPFRNKTIVAAVLSLHEARETKHPLKPLGETYGHLRLSATTLHLLHALSARAFTSMPSVLHAWLGVLPKRAGTTPTAPKQSSLLASREERYLADRFTAPRGVLATVRELAHQKKRVLVLTPWTHRARWIAEQLNAECITSDDATGARFRAWSGFVRNTHGILVGTRMAAWLAGEADVVILEEPENDDHKQDELAPRYDARWLVDRAATLGVSVIEIGLTPRLSCVVTSTSSAESRRMSYVVPACSIDSTHDARRTTHAWIDTHRADWSPIASLQRRTVTQIEEALRAQQPVYIIHPIHGDRARLRCADCGWTALCERCGAGLTTHDARLPTHDSRRTTPDARLPTHDVRLICMRCHHTAASTVMCPTCGGSDLSRARPGRERLIADLDRHGFHKNVHVFSLGEWNELNELPSHACIVVTDLSLLAGAAEDVRRRERLIVATRRIADQCAVVNGTLILQGEAQLLTDATTWLTAEGCEAALTRELRDRETFGLPPAVRLIKIIIRGTREDAQRVLTTLDPSVASGPWPVTHLASSRLPRWIIHLTLPKETTDEAITALLAPLRQTNILVDLDPVAFFE
jgi:primosomal protein N'